MTDYLVLDFESVDPYISNKHGSGWVFGIVRKDETEFKILGAAVLSPSDNRAEYLTSHSEILEIVRKFDTLVMHNASYDLGCLRYLEHKYSTDLQLETKTIIDTMLLGKLHNSTLFSYSLDNLSKKYLGKTKAHGPLLAAAEHLMPWTKSDLNKKKQAAKAGEAEYVRSIPEVKAIKFVKTNMDMLQESFPELMKEYAVEDAVLTNELYLLFKPCADQARIDKLSKLLLICNHYRRKGVRIDLVKARQTCVDLELLIKDKLTELYTAAGREFNINSSLEVPSVLDDHGIEYKRKVKTGNPNIESTWLAEHEHPICNLLAECRKLIKFKRDFLEKTVDNCKELFPEDTEYSRVYPELHILSARTGRFSCSNPNLQQIPARDEVYGPLCRSIFVPEEGDKWFSLDYSNQEGRMQLHYASRLRCTGVEEFVELFQKDPDFDMHQAIADMVGIDRRTAKVVNLGISYGMGRGKLAKQLGVSIGKAQEIIRKYHEKVPYLNELNTICQTALKSRGFITTLGGRKSHLDAGTWSEGKQKTFEYRALNKLIQGSAADQTIEAMLQAYDAGINVLFPVHDELTISGTYEQAVECKRIMETCCTLDVPVVVEFGKEGGNNWSEGGH